MCSLRMREQSRLWNCYNDRLNRHHTTNWEEGQAPSLRPMNEIFVASPRFQATFTLCVLFASGLVCMGQQQVSKASSDFQQVEVFIQQHRLYEAKTEVMEELQRHPSSVEGYNLLGIIQTDQQDDSGAIASFQRALQLNPSSTKTHDNLGNVYVALKQSHAAEKEFRTVVRLDPGDVDGNYNFGVLLMIKGSPAEAIPHFEQVRPMNVATRLNLVRLTS